MAGEDILVVDDNSPNLRLLEYILRARGYTVRTAASAGEALAAVRDRLPRMILMDLQMPGVDGYQLTRQLKADSATAHIVIIAVTAYAMKGDDERSRAAGCADHISKPIDRDRLYAVIEKHLAVTAS